MAGIFLIMPNIDDPITHVTFGFHPTTQASLIPKLSAPHRYTKPLRRPRSVLYSEVAYRDFVWGYTQAAIGASRS
jgi:hypothetical protein